MGGPIGNPPSGQTGGPMRNPPSVQMGGPVNAAPPLKKEPSAATSSVGRSPGARSGIPAAPNTVNKTAGSPSSSASATALGGLAAPPPPGSAANAYVECGKSLTQQPYIASIDGRGSGAVLTPGRASVIAGCGFGNKRGAVTISGSAGGISNLQLIIDAWNDTQIRARVDPNLGGVADQANIVLTVARADSKTLQANGHAFEAARDEILLPSMPSGLVTRLDLRDYPAPTQLTSPSPNGGTLFVGTDDQVAMYRCPTVFANGDRIDASRIALKNGFVLTRVEAFDQTRNFLGSRFSDYKNPLQSFGTSKQGNDLVVVPHWRESPGSPGEGAISMLPARCASAYEVRVYVRGPRGFQPL